VVQMNHLPHPNMMESSLARNRAREGRDFIEPLDTTPPRVVCARRGRFTLVLDRRLDNCQFSPPRPTRSRRRYVGTIIDDASCTKIEAISSRRGPKDGSKPISWEERGNLWRIKN
jgi:hypothetical protein